MTKRVLVFFLGLNFAFLSGQVLLLASAHAEAKNFQVPLDPNAWVRSKYHHRERGGIATGKDFIIALTSRGWILKVDQEGRVLWRREAGCNPVNGPVIDDTNLYYVCAEGTLFARELETGKELWRFQYKDSVAGMPALTQDLLVFQSGSGMIFCLSKSDGSLKWLSRQGGRTRLSLMGAGQPLIIRDRVFLGLLDGFVAELRLEDGSLVWKKQVFSRPIVSDFDYKLIADQDTLYASSLNGVCALSQTTGKVFWCVKEAVAGPAIQDDGHIYVLTKDQELLIIDKIIGLVEQKIQIPKSFLKKFEPEKFLAQFWEENNLIVVMSRGVWEIKLGTEKPKQIMRFWEPMRAGARDGKNRLYLLSCQGFLISKGIK